MIEKFKCSKCKKELFRKNIIIMLIRKIGSKKYIVGKCKYCNKNQVF